MSTVVESKNELGIIMEDDDADNSEDNNNNDHLPNNESPQQQQPLNASLKKNLDTDHPISEPPQQKQRPMQAPPSIFVNEEPTVVQPGEQGDNTNAAGQQKDNWYVVGKDHIFGTPFSSTMPKKFNLNKLLNFFI